MTHAQADLEEKLLHQTTENERLKLDLISMSDKKSLHKKRMSESHLINSESKQSKEKQELARRNQELLSKENEILRHELKTMREKTRNFRSERNSHKRDKQEADRVA